MFFEEEWFSWQELSWNVEGKIRAGYFGYFSIERLLQSSVLLVLLLLSEFAHQVKISSNCLKIFLKLNLFLRDNRFTQSEQFDLLLFFSFKNWILPAFSNAFIKFIRSCLISGSIIFLLGVLLALNSKISNRIEGWIVSSRVLVSNRMYLGWRVGLNKADLERSKY